MGFLKFLPEFLRKAPPRLISLFEKLKYCELIFNKYAYFDMF